MDSITKVSPMTASAGANIVIINVMAVICGLALVIFACVATNGLDMSPGFF
jgi:hypothetical protein